MGVQSTGDNWANDTYNQDGSGISFDDGGSTDTDNTTSGGGGTNVSSQEIQEIEDKLAQVEVDVDDLQAKVDLLRVPISALSNINTKNWSSGTSYSKGDIIVNTNNNNIYKAATSYTSASSLEEDINAGNLVLVGIPKVASAGKILYDRNDYTTVEQALDSLLYVAPSVAVSNNVGTVQLGQEITNVTLDWNVNKEIVSQTVNGDSVEVSQRTLNLDYSDNPITNNATFRVTIDDGQQTASDATGIRFMQKRWWGVTSSDTLSDVTTLGSNEFANSYRQTRTFDCSGGKYIYFAYPASWGKAGGFTVGGLAMGFKDMGTISHTNASGYTDDFQVYRIPDQQYGSSVTVKVK